MAEMRLNVALVVNAQGFVTGMASAKGSLKQFQNEVASANLAAKHERYAVGRVLGSLDQSLLGGRGGMLAGAFGAGGAIGVAGAGVGMGMAGGIYAFKKAMDESLDVVRQARRFGLNTEEYEKLAHASKYAGVEIEVTAKAMNRLMVRIGQARAGGPQKKVFEAMGLDPASLEGTSKLKVFEDVFRAIAKVKDETSRAKLEMEAFGKSGAELEGLRKRIEAGGLDVTVVSQEARGALSATGRRGGEASRYVWVKAQEAMAGWMMLGAEMKEGGWVTKIGSVVAGFSAIPTLGLSVLGLGALTALSPTWKEIEANKPESSKVSAGTSPESYSMVAEAALYGSKEAAQAILSEGQNEQINLLTRIAEAAELTAGNTPSEST